MKSILIFRSAALGDFIIATPAMAEVRKNFPNRHIVLLTIQSGNKKQRTMVAKYAGNTNNVPWIELVRPHLIDDFFVLGNFNLGYLIHLRRQLRAFDFESVILMMDPGAQWRGRIKKILLMFFLVGVVPILGWRGAGSVNRNRVKLKQKGILRHHVHGSLQFLSEMKPPRKYKNEDLKFDLRPSPEAKQWAKNWLSQNQLTHKRLVSMAPGALQPHKKWPEPLFAKLTSRLLSTYPDIFILIVGTQRDKPIGDYLRAISPERIFNLAGVTTIAQSAVLLQKCDLLVGNDGGAMHLGDAMGCKVVSIIPGIQYPDSIEPWHNKDLVVRHSVPCAPCYVLTHCPLEHNKCMTDLPVNAVWDKCNSVLQK